MTSYNDALVIDNGSSVCRAGLGGVDKLEPRVFYPSNGNRLEHQRIENDANQEVAVRYRYVGREREQSEPIVSEHPIKSGVVTNWEDMETIWRHLYDKLGIASEMDDHPVLITEAPLNPKANRDKMAQVLFESFHVPYVFFANPAVLALFGSGRQDGIVLDCGHDLSHIVPVHQGTAVDSAISRVELGGSDLTSYLTTMLKERGNTLITKDMTEDIKEKVCQVALNFQEESSAKNKDASYELPDGQIIVVKNEDRFRCPEVLFQPHLMDKDMDGLPDSVFRAITKFDVTVRAQMYSNILLAGGSTLFPGLPERFEQEMKSLAPPKAKIRIAAKVGRRHSAWLGGSILTSISTFQRMWISKKEYEEIGPSVVHRK